jgi:hypothetical protein
VEGERNVRAVSVACVEGERNVRAVSVDIHRRQGGWVGAAVDIIFVKLTFVKCCKLILQM